MCNYAFKNRIASGGKRILPVGLLINGPAYTIRSNHDLRNFEAYVMIQVHAVVVNSLHIHIDRLSGGCIFKSVCYDYISLFKSFY